MSLIATLVSKPSLGALDTQLADKVKSALGANAAPVWLSENEACDIVLPAGREREQASAELRAVLAGLPVDFAVQPGAGRRKAILIADMDSTMIEQECIDELADVVGIKDKVAAITARAMNGEIAFEPALRERVAFLKGLDVSVIGEMIDRRITLAPGASELVATMNAAGATTALVSGGFESFTQEIARRLGFQFQSANTLIEADGVLSGTVCEPILGRAAKAETLDRLVAEKKCARADVVAVGDGANDLDMIQIAGLGVAMHAKPAVAAQAQVRVDHGDLTALLFLQGYRRSEFVQPV